MARINMTKGLAIAGLLAASATAQAQVASFDCARAATPTERAVCATPELGRKDVALATWYDALLRLKPAVSGMAFREFRDGIAQAQRQWLRSQRDACGSDVACLRRAYDARLDAVRKTFDGNAGLTYGRMID